MMSTVQESARYEYRLFGQGFTAWHRRMARLSQPVPEKFWRRQSNEIYLLSRSDQRHNVKLRNQMLDIKVLLGQKQQLEQWRVMSKTSLPADRNAVHEMLLSAMATDDLELPTRVDAAVLVKAVKHQPDMQAVHVIKVREGYQIGDTLCEYAEVLVNGARLSSIAIEADDPQSVQQTLQHIDLPAEDNMSYPEAIRRVLGWSDAPLLIAGD